ncbi:MAG: hypothetical protein P4L33_13940 [Capsulimonadaceae bacterium]|nr:hypothetical protein [Capsulimonadaceae bacterium]
MIGTTEKQILKTLYQWGGEASKSTIEDNLQITLGTEIIELKGLGLIHIVGAAIALTQKGMKAVEVNNLVPSQTVQDNTRAREMVKKALRSVLEHDMTGYNATMQEARKAFPPRIISAIEKYYLHNLP